LLHIAEQDGIGLLPEQLDIPRIRADEQRLEVEVDGLLGDLRRERCVADADDPGAAAARFAARLADAR